MLEEYRQEPTNIHECFLNFASSTRFRLSGILKKDSNALNMLNLELSRIQSQAARKSKEKIKEDLEMFVGKLLSSLEKIPQFQDENKQEFKKHLMECKKILGEEMFLFDKELDSDKIIIAEPQKPKIKDFEMDESSEEEKIEARMADMRQKNKEKMEKKQNAPFIAAGKNLKKQTEKRLIEERKIANISIPERYNTKFHHEIFEYLQKQLGTKYHAAMNKAYLHYLDDTDKIIKKIKKGQVSDQKLKEDIEKSVGKFIASFEKEIPSLEKWHHVKKIDIVPLKDSLSALLQDFDRIQITPKAKEETTIKSKSKKIAPRFETKKTKEKHSLIFSSLQEIRNWPQKTASENTKPEDKNQPPI